MIKNLVVLLTLSLFACSEEQQEEPSNSSQEDNKAPKIHLVDSPPIYDNENNIVAIVEIPAGSTEKWEVNKVSGEIERDSINGAPRTIEYLGYPANYGFVPRTILPKELGGDGDPLDAIILGAPFEKGTMVHCDIIGILKLKDRGEQDDKLILAHAESPFCDNRYDEIEKFKEDFPGILEIVELWFVHYKGPGKMVSEGFANKSEALKMIEESHNQYNITHLK
ncbi:MAG: inorganic diphosphatase [Crocinitomicaceae bacterium]